MKLAFKILKKKFVQFVEKRHFWKPCKPCTVFTEHHYSMWFYISA